MDSSVTQVGSGGSLGRWILAPLLALCLILVLIFQLPGSDCNGDGPRGSSLQETALLVVTAVASLGAIAAALRHWVPLVRRGRGWYALAGCGIAALVALAVLLVFDSRDNGRTFGIVFLGGAALTGVALLGLLMAWGTGRKVDDVGPLLPLYLLGAGVFCYPPTAIAALVLSSGALC